METGVTDGTRQVLHIVLETWRKVLEKPELSSDDDFFAAGGHSMLALRIVFELEDRLATEIPVDALFEHATARRLADHLASSGRVKDPEATD